MKAIIGRKLGMTRVFDEDGRVIPVTVIEAGPCPVVQVREAAHGQAVQIGFGVKKATRTSKALSGHVGKAVAHLAQWLGFRVVVTDDRPEFATPEAVPSADEHIVCALSELPTRIRVDQDSYVLLTTRGMPVDIEGLPALLETAAAYIGVIGSRRRWEVCLGKLQDGGMSDDDIARITSPIGLELNAESPEEIAVSIMAELIMLRRKGTGERMQQEP